jgi:hypothetical protein
MGWKEREARQAVDAGRAHVGPDESIEAVLRKCLSVLRLPIRGARAMPAQAAATP